MATKDLWNHIKKDHNAFEYHRDKYQEMVDIAEEARAKRQKYDERKYKEYKRNIKFHDYLKQGIKTGKVDEKYAAEFRYLFGTFLTRRIERLDEEMGYDFADFDRFPKAVRLLLENFKKYPQFKKIKYPFKEFISWYEGYSHIPRSHSQSECDSREVLDDYKKLKNLKGLAQIKLKLREIEKKYKKFL